MASWLVRSGSGASGPSSSHGCMGTLCCVLGEDTFTLTVPLSTQVPLSNAGGDPAMDWHPIQGGRGAGRNTPSRFILQKPG